MAIIQIDYTEEADCRVPDSTLRKESIELEFGKHLSYKQVIEQVSQQLNINTHPDDFHCEMQAPILRDMSSLNVEDILKTSHTMVLVNGELKVLSSELAAQPVWTSDQDTEESVPWWMNRISCHVTQKYSKNFQIHFKILLAPPGTPCKMFWTHWTCQRLRQ